MKPTPHIQITDKEDLAKTILMPGDPLRAKFIAENFLKDYKLVNEVRGALAYTGYYKKHKVTVFASGMGQASIGIYSYELFNHYGVENIIRIGSAGSYNPELKVYDVVLCKKAFSESTFAKVAYGYNKHTILPSKDMNKKVKRAARKLKINLKEATVHSSDVFYHDSNVFNWQEFSKAKGLDCVEMEAYALFANAAYAGKNAACLLTISDSFITHEETTSEERRAKLLDMVRIALETAVLYD